jgi:flagellar biosynthesis/type III secretory pathway chaperone
MSILEIKSMLVDEIQNKKIDLVNTLEDLEEERASNEFLSEIAQDYKRYNKFIHEQKKRQIDELTKILDYLDQLLETQAITQYTLSHTKNEQKRIVNEIKTLQKDMDNLISDIV